CHLGRSRRILQLAVGAGRPATSVSAAGWWWLRAVPAGEQRVPAADRSRFFFQAEDGIRDIGVTGVQTLLFRSAAISSTAVELIAAHTPETLPQRPRLT